MGTFCQITNFFIQNLVSLQITQNMILYVVCYQLLDQIKQKKGK
ncbi:MAG: hypothetical protein JETT_1623 [Candidatus Jettenia ecosi]|uniref:Uncharacterized protein n=1 Tax=Candidatus Jettenia ecosi TaxID=2494326 RepID=A0A533QBP4_9BACT|nr:MAG: hypothetical protein JETT_1623 [Candidatus Jettenia ecosi]